MDQLYYKIMEEKTSKELVRLVYFERNSFHHEGVSVAEEEIKRRGISESEIEQYKTEIASDISKENDKANIPLEPLFKVLSFLLPGALPFIMAKRFEESGEITKAKQLRQWSTFGFVFYSVLLISLLFVVKK